MTDTFFNGTLPSFNTTSNNDTLIPGLTLNTFSDLAGHWQRVCGTCDHASNGGVCPKKESHKGWDSLTWKWNDENIHFDHALNRKFINEHNRNNAIVRKLIAAIHMFALQGIGGFPQYPSRFLGQKTFIRTTPPLEIVSTGDHSITCVYNDVNTPFQFSITGGGAGTLLTIGQLLLNDSTCRTAGFLFYALDHNEDYTQVTFHTWNPTSGSRVLSRANPEIPVSVTPCFLDGDGKESFPRIRDINPLYSVQTLWTLEKVPTASRITVLEYGSCAPGFSKVDVMIDGQWVRKPELNGCVRNVARMNGPYHRVICDLTGFDVSGWQDLRIVYFKEDTANPAGINLCQFTCAHDIPDYTNSIGHLNFLNSTMGVKYYCNRRSELLAQDKYYYFPGRCLNSDCPFYTQDTFTDGLKELQQIITSTPLVRKHEQPFGQSADENMPNYDSAGSDGWRTYHYGMPSLYSMCNPNAFDTGYPNILSPEGHYEQHDWSLMTGGWGQVKNFGGLIGQLYGYEVLELLDNGGQESLYQNEASYGPGGNLKPIALLDCDSNGATSENDKMRLCRSSVSRGYFAHNRYERTPIDNNGFGKCIRFKNTTLIFPNIPQGTFNDGQIDIGHWDQNFADTEQPDGEDVFFRTRIKLNNKGIRTLKTSVFKEESPITTVRVMDYNNDTGDFKFYLQHKQGTFARSTSEPGELDSLYNAYCPGSNVLLPENVRYRNYACQHSVTGTGGGDYLRPGYCLLIDGDGVPDHWKGRRLKIQIAIAADPSSNTSPYWDWNNFYETAGLPPNMQTWGGKMDSITIGNEGGIISKLLENDPNFFYGRDFSILSNAIALPGATIFGSSPDGEDVQITAFTELPDSGIYYIEEDISQTYQCLVMNVPLFDRLSAPSASHDLNTVLKSLVNIVEGQKRY